MIRPSFRRDLLRRPARLVAVACLLLAPAAVRAQGSIDADSMAREARLDTIRITARRAGRRSIAPLPETVGAALFSGRKTESIAVGDLDANAALNSVRQTFARTPGIFAWEQDGGGVQVSVATRGLSPNRSWEFNTRQDGADIASDPFGYPEAYYQPPFEALQRIELVRGAASLQFGPQFGGLLNYVMKQAPEGRRFALESTHLGGSNALYSTYTGVGGNAGRFSWYGALNHRRGDGWRDGGEFAQTTEYASVSQRVGRRGRLGASITHMAYEMRQPGGLTEAQFGDDARQAVRGRDWFAVPWTIPSLTWDQQLGARTSLSAKLFGLVGERRSVGLTTAPTVRDTLLNARRVDEDRYGNVGTELRVLHHFSLGGHDGALATGARLSRGETTRRRGRGTDGDDASFAFTRDLLLDLDFVSRNAAAFAEVKLPLGSRLSLTPGVRLEHIRSDGEGYWTPGNAQFERTAAPNAFDRTTRETVPLAGLAASWLSSHFEVYANVAGAYRPALFSELFPTDLVAVDPSLRSSRGAQVDLGVRGTRGEALAWDASVFHLRYDGRVGTLNRRDLGADSVLYPAGLRTNVGESRHYGFEAFAELDLLHAVGATALAERVGSVSLFTSAARTVATYAEGPLEGRQVEHSPDWIVRAGATLRVRDRLTTTLQGSSVGAAYSDASNTVFQANGLQGIIPAYTVWDLSLRGSLARWLELQVSANNLFDKRYFTRRATGFPGPGIVPADGRIVTAGLRMVLPGR